MLWIPTTLTERQFWAEKIYGVADPESDYPSQYGGNGPYDRFFVTRYIAKRPPLSPFWEPFWKDYGFPTEVELDAFLNQYIFKLKNFVWENALKAVQDHINKSRTYVNEYGSTVTIPEQTIQTVLALHQMEYEHYLGPIKYALKYDKGGKVIPLHIPYATLMLGRSPFGGWAGVLGTISSCGSTTRQSIIITLYDGTKIQVPSKGPTEYYDSGGVRRHGWWYLSLKEILEIAKLPNVVSIEASDTPYPNAEVYNVAPTAWNKAKQQIYANYVKYMQSPPPPTTQPGTQPPGAQPSGAAVTSKTWTWIAIGGAAILLLLLLARRK
jgi:hypothetical protein